MTPPEGDAAAALPAIPSVDRVLRWAGVAALVAQHGHTLVASHVKAMLADARSALRDSQAMAFDVRSEAGIADELARRVAVHVAPAMRPAFNLTGTVLHTNLGRALLCDAAAEEVARVARSPVNLEMDLATGERGDRDSAVEPLLCEITGAEAATVVNNNAAAVLLTIAALAGRREAVISRGELVEIGGAFRMPDVMRCAGARMVEVGTTNRTHARDFSAAITRRTGLVLKVHTSNYVVQGFTSTVPEPELARIAHDAGVPFAIDLGSGSLVDLSLYGLPREPLVQDALASGADVVTFSGDKLLGGPQAGIVVGKREWVQRIRKHPMKRALRVSKLTLAALERTLDLYRRPEKLRDSLPTLRSLARPASDIEAQASRLVDPVRRAVGEGFEASVVTLASQIGSGALPVDRIPSAGIAVRCTSAKGAGRRLAALAGAFRRLPMPVIGRIAADALTFDLRMLEDEQGFASQLSRLRVAGSGAP